VEVKTAIEINKTALVTMRARQDRARTFTAQRGAAAFVTVIFPASVVTHWSMSATSADRTDVQQAAVTLQHLDDIRMLGFTPGFGAFNAPLRWASRPRKGAQSRAPTRAG
jgi:hypothetical protein